MSKYVKLTQREHVLHRPDTYIGPVLRETGECLVHTGEEFEVKTVEYSPGLLKIFDEILVNAADHAVRAGNVTYLKVAVDAESFTVENDGTGIPIEIHAETGVYVPELIFGHLLTSENYDDSEERIVGGRNGFGAKLANVFAKRFVVTVSNDGKKYTQVFTDNLSVIKPPKIIDVASKKSCTRVQCHPDFAVFGGLAFDDDSIALLRKRVVDIAAILKNVKVSWNGARVPVKSFYEYSKQVTGVADGGVYVKPNERWEFYATAGSDAARDVSFVNGVCTTRGGTHVELVANQITKYVAAAMTKKLKRPVKPATVRAYLRLVVNSVIVNPVFSSQTKDVLTTKPAAFGSTCLLDESAMKRILAKTGIADLVTAAADSRTDKASKKTDGVKRSRVDVPKLDDANDAGTRKSSRCTIILTEGDSAKTLAVAGVSVVGRDSYGIFPLRGKLLNVRDASATQINGNVEIQALKTILGLQHGKAYTDTSGLRYGRVMIMADQDTDGTHIAGLLMNYFACHYPSLLENVPGFLVRFVTPIVKAKRGNVSKSFYSIPEYDAWRALGDIAGYSVKYYKGLGTSTSAEAREYFSNLPVHVKTYDFNAGLGGLDLAFNKSRADDRKKWLSEFIPGTCLDSAAPVVSCADFVDRDLVLFSRADLERSIPSVVDGLKPSQRKILYACFTRNLRADMKVAQLAGYVAEKTAYHHGEQSLVSTIVGMAQDFVGSNNVNLLVPSGQFGSRRGGGSDSASARYIFTRLAEITRKVFHPDDDPVLTHLTDDGMPVEPEYYVPVIPMVLVNGAAGIGTGWSTKIPNFSLHDVVENTRRLVQGLPVQEILPKYRGFTGFSTDTETRGIVTRVSDLVYRVTELPVGVWTQNYSEFLAGLVKSGVLADVRENHTETNVHFDITLNETCEDMEGFLKLRKPLGTGNFVLFDAAGKIRKYDGVAGIFEEHYAVRLEYYAKRKSWILARLRADEIRARNKSVFVDYIVSGKLAVTGRTKAEIIEDLSVLEFDRVDGGYEYLLGMSVSSLTTDRAARLREESAKVLEILKVQEGVSETSMWLRDLDELAELAELAELEDSEPASKRRKV